MPIPGTSPCPLCLSTTYTCPRPALRLGPPERSVNMQLNGSRSTRAGYGSLTGPPTCWCSHALTRTHPMNVRSNTALKERKMPTWLTKLPRFTGIPLWPAYLCASVSPCPIEPLWNHAQHAGNTLIYSRHAHFSLTCSLIEFYTLHRHQIRINKFS